MPTIKVYVAGPMTGLPDWNFPAFNAKAAELRALGFIVSNPAELANGDTSKPWDYYMRLALTAMLTCDAVYALTGWGTSRGAKIEVELASDLGIPVFYQNIALREYWNPDMAKLLSTGAHNDN